MISSLCLPLLAAGLTGLANAASNDEWAARSIYQVITDRFARPDGSSDGACNITNYCGGTWSGIVDQLDYIQGMGFTAIQISPVSENLKETTIYGQAFHGYWVQNLYELNANFGSAADLKNLSAELHKRDMYLLVDVVANEMAYDIGDTNMTDSTVIDYSEFYPFDNSDYFHPYCPIVDWDNQTQLDDCWLGYTGVATPHLKNEDATVAGMLEVWIAELISNYSIDGIRIDGAKQISTSFFQPFIEKAGVYAMSEVDDGDPSFTCKYQTYSAGLENYPVYYQILAAFTDGKMADLVSMVNSVKSDCSSIQYLTTFIENQDNERFASYVSDIALAKNALAFTILADGIPKMYYGQEQHLTGNYSPYNRQPLWESSYDTTAPLYTLTAALNTIRNHAINTDSTYVTNTSTLLYTDDSTYATRKGPNGAQIVAVLSNQGTSGGSYELSVPGAANEGTKMTEVIGCTTVVAGTNGTIVVSMDNGAPKVFFPTSNLNGSGLCGTVATSTSGSSATTTGSSASGTSTKKGSAASIRASVWVMLVSVGMVLFVFL